MSVVVQAEVKHQQTDTRGQGKRVIQTPAMVKDVKCPQTGVSTEDGEPQQILGMVQCHGRDPPSLILPSDSIKDTLMVMLQRSNQQTFC
ncbi:hypothetical protein DPX16_13529 [Anabarilius grahami]|uniref:Uncharacterized protein n=1 Tax=Anabarilius grahami TaxID=495550 RepID=A0A3N0YCV3_ANAGA|nr:hypothetical protein DPX16_13529 [Anabarilius grahami]